MITRSLRVRKTLPGYLETEDGFGVKAPKILAATDNLGCPNQSEELDALPLAAHSCRPGQKVHA